MAVTSLDQITTAIESIDTRYQISLARILPSLETDTQTAQQVRGFKADLVGFQGDVRSVRQRLDEIDAVDFLFVANGERTIGIWQWQRETRQALVDEAGAFRETFDQTDELDRGKDAQTVVTHDGDTLQSLAAQHLGSFDEWERLLEANPGLEPGRVAAGLTLVIPQRR